MSVPARSAALWEAVLGVLATDEFRARGAVFDRRPLIDHANALGGPRMRLLHAGTLARLRRVPRSDEGFAVDALAGIDSYGAQVVEVFMVSHRWLRPSLNPAASHPDNDAHDKATALDQFSQWRRQWVRHRHGFLPEIFYWIDYACIDQDDPAASVPLLPLWVACCERFVRVETADYDERAWCRVEPLLSSAFSFADHHASIGLDYRCRWPDFGEETTRPILDPRGGKLTNPADMGLIDALAEVAERTRAPRGQGAGAVKCYRL